MDRWMDPLMNGLMNDSDHNGGPTYGLMIAHKWMDVRSDLLLSNRATEQSGMPGCPVGGSWTLLLPSISTRQPS